MKKWINSISWEPVHLNAPCRRFVSASKDTVARIWDISLNKCMSQWPYTVSNIC
jgi:ribosome assembly protein 4